MNMTTQQRVRGWIMGMAVVFLWVFGSGETVHAFFQMHSIKVQKNWFADTQDDHGNTPENATVILPDSNTSGHAGGMFMWRDVDCFQITLETAGTLVLYTTGDTDTEGVLREINAAGARNDYEETHGVLLAAERTGGDGRNFLLSEHLAAGTYFVYVGKSTFSFVSQDRGGSGDYVLHSVFYPWPAANGTIGIVTALYSPLIDGTYGVEPFADMDMAYEADGFVNYHDALFAEEDASQAVRQYIYPMEPTFAGAPGTAGEAVFLGNAVGSAYDTAANIVITTALRTTTDRRDQFVVLHLRISDDGWDVVPISLWGGDVAGIVMTSKYEHLQRWNFFPEPIDLEVFEIRVPFRTRHGDIIPGLIQGRVQGNVHFVDNSSIPYSCNITFSFETLIWPDTVSW